MAFGPVEIGNNNARDAAMVTGIMKKRKSVSSRVASVGTIEKNTAAMPFIFEMESECRQKHTSTLSAHNQKGEQYVLFLNIEPRRERYDTSSPYENPAHIYLPVLEATCESIVHRAMRMNGKVELSQLARQHVGDTAIGQILGKCQSSCDQPKRAPGQPLLHLYMESGTSPYRRGYRIRPSAIPGW
jgi:hypothetical protein